MLTSSRNFYIDNVNAVFFAANYAALGAAGPDGEGYFVLSLQIFQNII
jgi:hypothetical protein